MSDDERSEYSEGEPMEREEEEEEKAWDPSAVQDPETVRARIDEALEMLENLSSANKPRSDIMTDLARDLSEYYNYLPELTELFLDLFSPAECVEFMDANDRPRPLVIRANTLKTTRKDLMEALTKRGAAVEAIDWCKVAIKVTESSVPIGATPEYLAGHYMLQAASSMNPVLALDAQPGERVLDMSSAPGGKTSYVAQMMKNSGIVIANDLKAQRQKATIANLQRLGVKNSIVCCHDGRHIANTFRGFDRVLLDAPCSGLGIIARDQSVKLQRSLKDIQRNAHLQKELLRAAIDVVDCNSASGGIVVYSTCSVSVEENEMVIQYILEKRFVKVVETGLQVGKPGLTRHKQNRFHPSLAHTRRFYPHVHNMDGFYVAKLKKYKNGPRDGAEDDDEDEDDEPKPKAGKLDKKRKGEQENDAEEEEDEDDEEEGDSEEEDGDEEESEESEPEVPPPKKGKTAPVAAPAKKTEPVVAKKAEPVVAKKAEPVVAKKAEPVVAKKAEPVVAKKAEPVVAKKAEPVVAKKAEPVVAKKAEPVVAKKAEPVVAKKAELEGPSKKKVKVAEAVEEENQEEEDVVMPVLAMRRPKGIQALRATLKAKKHMKSS